MAIWCPGLGKLVVDCGEPCIGSSCLRVARGVRPTETTRPFESLVSELERLSHALLRADKDNAELRTENALLGDRLARVVGCLRAVSIDMSAFDVLTRVRVELAK